MEIAEHKRLFYVACTRAADLLLLSGRASGSNTWMDYALDAWEIPAEGSADETILDIRVLRPNEVPELDRRDSVPVDVQAGGVTAPRLAEPLLHKPAVQPVAVTRLARGLLDQEALLQVVPAVHADRQRAQAPAIGDIIHHALADWACLALPPAERVVWLANGVRRSGVRNVEAVVSRAEEVLGRLVAHPLYQEIETAQSRYPELPFTWDGPARTVHGYIDLLYRDANSEWRLVDWKTGEYCEARIEEYHAQVAIYADAVEALLGVRPRASVCFLEPEITLI
jgi:ATP-dependent exoDNAse (exonuclease V) beta subunit